MGPTAGLGRFCRREESLVLARNRIPDCPGRIVVAYLSNLYSSERKQDVRLNSTEYVCSVNHTVCKFEYLYSEMIASAEMSLCKLQLITC
jgi:hypothetical protein